MNASVCKNHIVLYLYTVAYLVNRTTVSRNSWKDIRPSLSLSTQLNICFTNSESGFIPRASANSFFDRDVRITIMTSFPTCSNFRFSPGFSPKVCNKGKRNKSTTLFYRRLFYRLYIAAGNVSSSYLSLWQVDTAIV